MNRIGQSVAVMAMMLALPACAGSQLGDVLGGVLNPGGAAGGQQGEMLVEVQGVNSQQQTIAVRNEQGENATVFFDQRTVVVYQQQEYPPTALERGDVVVMQLQQIDGNRLYAARVDVRQSVQERTGQAGNAQLQRATGRVGQIDHQRGTFGLQTQQGTYTVFLSSNAGQANLDYFHRLRTGESVTIEGTAGANGRIDLYRFL